MKKLGAILCLCAGIAAVGIGVLWQPEPQPLPTESRQETPPDAVAFLIQRLKTPVTGTVIQPKTTAELRAWFADSQLDSQVPRVFVKRLPDDFVTQGDKVLFAKVITALVLRENERLLKERAALILLKNKAGSWSTTESDFFGELVTRYQAKSQKTVPAQLDDLIHKIDTIPPMMAVIQAAEATDWGRKNPESPFEQMAWLDTKTYARQPFSSLMAATTGYADEVNGLPSLKAWRVARDNLRTRGQTDVGYRVLRWLNDYKLEDADYTQKLYRRAQELGQDIPDDIRFKKSDRPSFDTGIVHIGSHPITVEIAQTDRQKQYGLMFRSNIPTDTGMLFINANPVVSKIWMKNTFVPLDVVFFDKSNRVTHIIQNLQPLDETPQGPDVPVSGFIEMPAGMARRLDIRVGTLLTLPQL